MPSDAASLRAVTGFRLVTADLPRLTRFYVDVLGFVPDGEPRPIAAQEMRDLGLPGTGTRQALRLGGQALGLDTFSVPGAAYPGGDAAAPWFQHLALVVPDMDTAYSRLAGVAAISAGGPQQLPASSGGVSAFKFRDPDGHPLELLHFPPDSTPGHWQRAATASGPVSGIDHSAISVRDVRTSIGFYAALGLRTGERSLNRGPAQERLDQLAGVQVDVVPLLPAEAPPHLELLAYRHPGGTAAAPWRVNDVAATRVVWRGSGPALLRDPDGHLHQLDPGAEQVG